MFKCQLRICVQETNIKYVIYRNVCVYPGADNIRYVTIRANRTMAKTSKWLQYHGRSHDSVWWNVVFGSTDRGISGASREPADKKAFSIYWKTDDRRTYNTITFHIFLDDHIAYDRVVLNNTTVSIK